MRFEFIGGHEKVYPVRRMCRVLEVSEAGYWAWKRRPEGARKQEQNRLRGAVRQSFEASRRTYGSPRVHADLKSAGVRAGRHRVARLMRLEGLSARRRNRKVRTTVAGETFAPNVLDRRFTQPEKNRAWAADLTYLATKEGFLYLAVLLDLYSRRVIGWSLSERRDRKLVLDALKMALSSRETAPGLIHHSDRGSEYGSGDYRTLLEKHGIVPSMSRTGECHDNAVAESFFGTLKAECGDWFDSRGSARTKVFDYLEIFYNRQRRHSTLNYLSPVDFEARGEQA